MLIKTGSAALRLIIELALRINTHAHGRLPNVVIFAKHIFTLAFYLSLRCILCHGSSFSLSINYQIVGIYRIDRSLFIGATRMQDDHSIWVTFFRLWIKWLRRSILDFDNRSFFVGAFSVLFAFWRHDWWADRLLGAGIELIFLILLHRCLNVRLFRRRLFYGHSHPTTACIVVLHVIISEATTVVSLDTITLAIYHANHSSLRCCFSCFICSIYHLSLSFSLWI